MLIGIALNAAGADLKSDTCSLKSCAERKGDMKYILLVIGILIAFTLNKSYPLGTGLVGFGFAMLLILTPLCIEKYSKSPGVAEKARSFLGEVGLIIIGSFIFGIVGFAIYLLPFSD